MTELSSSDITALVKNLGVNCRIFMSDATYNTPSKTWLLTTFYVAVEKLFNFVGLGKWKPDWDCDNFARFYATHAQTLHARDKKNTAEGIAVGEFWYTQKDGTGHAINIAVVDRTTVILIEPQSGGEMTLTDDEITSAFFIRF